MDKLLAIGLKKAKSLTKKHAKTFYFASRFLSQEKRQAAYAVYAICRLSDDSVDSASGSIEKLKNIEAKINSTYSPEPLQEPLLIAFKNVVKGYKIPQVYFKELIKGMYLDLEKEKYNDFKELYNYCYKVAGVVGLIMLQIFGYQDENAKKPAVDLGIAMQLTNILRDIKEDFQLGRVYLPQDELRQFNLSEDDLKAERLDEKFIDFMKFQIQRARTYYQSAQAGIKMIIDRKSRFVVCAMSEIYGAILNQIEKNSYDVFSKRASTSSLTKLVRLAKIISEGKYQ